VPQEHVENADTQSASTSLRNEPPPLDPLENKIGQLRTLLPRSCIGSSAPIAAVRRTTIEPPESTHKRHSAETLLDHLVGNVEDARRDSEAERLGSVNGVNVSFREPLDVEEG
jgi:hypothetical protein